MSLELLEGLEGMDVGVGVVKAHHEAHSHEVVLIKMIEEGASVGVSVRQRPSHRVFNTARRMFFRFHPPQLLDPNAVDLVLVVLVQVELLHDALGQVTPAALAEDGALGPELHASFKTVFGRSVLKGNQLFLTSCDRKL